MAQAQATGALMQFRAAALADVPRLAVLVNCAYRGDSSRHGWTTEADLLDGQRTDEAALAGLIGAEDSIILLALQDTALIGSVHLSLQQQCAMLGMLVIRPDLQGRGLGKIFLQAAEATAIKIWGVKKIAMQVITLRHELIRFYQRRGYSRTGIFQPFPQDVRFGLPRVDGLQLERMEKNVL